MPRLGRTPFLRKQYRWSLDPNKQPKPTPREVEQLKQQAARRAARGFV